MSRAAEIVEVAGFVVVIGGALPDRALSEGAPRNAIVYGQPYTIDRVGGQRRARQLGMNLLPFARRDWNLTTYRSLIAKLFGGVVGLNVTSAIVGMHGLKRRPPVTALGNFGGSVLLGNGISIRNP